MDVGCPMRRLRWAALFSALLASACSTQMQMSVEDLGPLGPTEGIVVGSFEVRGGGDVLGRKRWELSAYPVKSGLASLVPSGSGYQVQASRGEAEEVFVTRMEAGDYWFSRLTQPGFSSFTAATNVRFSVQAGRTVYVGRLVVEFPPGWVAVGMPFRTVVEDAGASTLETARERYGLASGEVVTDLMTVLD